jgi:hypothetical protein
MSLEDLFNDQYSSALISENASNTITYARESASDFFNKKIDVGHLIGALSAFNDSVDVLRGSDIPECYTTFFIPKHTGGLRRIDAPKQELMDALRRLKVIFEQQFGVLYHTCAFAYVRNRSTIDAVKRHQANQSRWFGKFDFKDFFGSTTLDFVMKQFSSIFPFSEVVKYPVGKAELTRALELAFLNNGLPQGTPISPLITNVMMIPIDHKLSGALRDFDRNRFVYTRYADDIHISSRYSFNIKTVEGLVSQTLKEFGAPFSINHEKTKYGSSSGRNWMLGVMLNKDNDITIGHRKKKQFQSMLYNYVRDRNNGVAWDAHDVQTLKGYQDYYSMVEKDAIKNIVSHISEKMSVDINQLIRQDLTNLAS